MIFFIDPPVEEKPAPKKRNKQASKKALVNSAIDLFSELGFHKATTSSIAKKAGLNEQLITRYFGGKKGLLTAVFSDFIQREENDETYINLPPSATVQGELENFLISKHKQISNTEKHLKIALPQLIYDQDIREDLLNALTDHTGQILETRLNNFKKHGLINKDVNIKNFVLSLTCQIFSMSFLIKLINNDDPNTIQKQLLDHIGYLACGISKK